MIPEAQLLAISAIALVGTISVVDMLVDIGDDRPGRPGNSRDDCGSSALLGGSACAYFLGFVPTATAADADRAGVDRLTVIGALEVAAW